MIVISQDQRRGVLLLPWMWRRVGHLPGACHQLPDPRALKRSGLLSVLVTLLLGGVSALSAPAADPVAWLTWAGALALALQLLHLVWVVARCGNRVPLATDLEAVGRPLNGDERTAYAMYAVSLLFAFGLLSDGDPSRAMLWIAAIVGALLLLTLPALGGGHAHRHPLLGGRAGPPAR